MTRNHRPHRPTTAAGSVDDFSGTVVGGAHGRWLVRAAGAGHPDVLCSLRGRLRHALAERGDTAVVGDVVRVRAVGGGTGGVVTAVETRRSALTRRAAGRAARPQVLAANVDTVLVAVAAAAPVPRWPLLDRLLVEAEASGVTPVVCLTKCDLAAPAAESTAGVARRSVETSTAATPAPLGLADDGVTTGGAPASVGTSGAGEAGPTTPRLTLYESLGYRTIRTSAHTGQGLDALRGVLAGRATVVVGMSGVGKSSLLAALIPGFRPVIGDVSAATGKGRHTTVSRELHDLPGGGTVIDSPGVREFGLWDVPPADLPACFPEMRPLLGQCRFGGCRHVDEPGCAVRAAAGIHPARYASYRKMLGAAAVEGRTSHDADSQRRLATASVTPPPVPAFACARCGHAIPATAAGSTHRNHCPRCLHSVHVDVRPGDGAAACGAVMEPIAVWARDRGEWAVIHRCTACGTLHSNRAAGDDSEVALVAVALGPLARMPFPVEALAAVTRP